MKRLNITKERYEGSSLLQSKYGKLEYVSESGKFYKTDKGQILRFNETVARRGRAKPMATIEDFDPVEPEGEFILTLADQNGDTEEIHFYMDIDEDWGNLNNNAGCFWKCDPDDPEPELFDGVGYGNDADGYKKVVKVFSVDLNKEMEPEVFGELCDQYVDWYSA